MFKSLKLRYILEMKDPLRNFLDKIKPTFQGKGGLSYYFPIFDVIENLFFLQTKEQKA